MAWSIQRTQLIILGHKKTWELRQVLTRTSSNCFSPYAKDIRILDIVFVFRYFKSPVISCPLPSLCAIPLMLLKIPIQTKNKTPDMHTLKYHVVSITRPALPCS
jgi:hypothetical protein